MGIDANDIKVSEQFRRHGAVGAGRGDGQGGKFGTDSPRIQRNYMFNMPGEAGDHAVAPLNGGNRPKGEMTKSPGIGLHLQGDVDPLKLLGLRPDANPEILGG